MIRVNNLLLVTWLDLGKSNNQTAFTKAKTHVLCLWPLCSVLSRSELKSRLWNIEMNDTVSASPCKIIMLLHLNTFWGTSCNRLFFWYKRFWPMMTFLFNFIWYIFSPLKLSKFLYMYVHMCLYVYIYHIIYICLIISLSRN